MPGGFISQTLLLVLVGVVYVVEQLDYETTQKYELTLRATDSVTGAYADVLVSITVEDINDFPPMFTQPSYNSSVSEAASFGTSILKVSILPTDDVHVLFGWLTLHCCHVLSFALCLEQPVGKKLMH